MTHGSLVLYEGPESLFLFALLNFLFITLEGVSGPQAHRVHPLTHPPTPLHTD